MNSKLPFIILVVDDEELNLDIMDDFLSPAGYKTVLLDSPLKALEKLKTDLKPDLIISDLNMPDMNGFRFYEEVQDIQSLDLIPFIFLTSMFDEQNIRYGKELGADDYLKKPVKKEDLIACIKGKLKKSKKLSSSVNSEVDRLKDNILQMLSHELRTPVTNMVGFSQLLSDESIPLSAEELKDFLNVIREGGDRIMNLTQDFFDTLSVDSEDVIKTYNSYKSNFDLLPVLNEVISDYKSEFEKKNISIETDYKDNLPLIFACPLLIKNILKRIISNSIKFNLPDKKIIVTLTPEYHFLDLSIEDQGIGIPDAEIPNIFNKFYQVNRNKYEQQGSGSGLYIVKKMAEANKCEILCKSVLNEGSVFTLKIPLAI